MLAALALVALATPAPDAAIAARVAAVLRRVPLVDEHNDLAWAIRESGRGPPGYDLRAATPGHTNLARPYLQPYPNKPS